jgi:import inner membrane translocase subunit TIM23
MLAETKVICEHTQFRFCYLPPSATKKKFCRMSFLDFQRDKRAKGPAEPQDSSSVISAVPVVHADPQRQAQQVEVVTANDVLARAFDATRLHPLAGIGDQGQLDYLLLDDDKLNTLPGAQTALPSRGWTDDLCYGTGTTYLTGKPVS